MVLFISDNWYHSWWYNGRISFNVSRWGIVMSNNPKVTLSLRLSELHAIRDLLPLSHVVGNATLYNARVKILDVLEDYDEVLE